MGTVSLLDDLCFAVEVGARMRGRNLRSPLALSADSSRQAGDRCCPRRCCWCRFRRGFHSTLWAAVRIQTNTRTGLNFCYRKQEEHQQSVFGSFVGALTAELSPLPSSFPVVNGLWVKVSVRFLWQFSVLRKRGTGGLLPPPPCRSLSLTSAVLQPSSRTVCVWYVWFQGSFRLLTRWPIQWQVLPRAARWASTLTRTLTVLNVAFKRWKGNISIVSSC